VEDSALFTPAAREWSRKERLDLETDFPAPYLDEKLSLCRGLFRPNMSQSCWVSDPGILQEMVHIRVKRVKKNGDLPQESY
jgi:hypothetical protein